MSIQPQSHPHPSSSSSTSSSSSIMSFQALHTLRAHTQAVTALKFSQDGKILVSAGADGFLHFWTKDGVHIRSLQSHKTGINDISISPDSMYVATASDDLSTNIHGINLDDAPLRVLKAHTAPVLAVAFNPKSNLVVSGSFDESAIVWDVRRGRALRTIPAHADAIWTVGWDPEGALVITGSADGLIRMWDVNTGQCLRTLDNDSNAPVSFVSFTPSSFFILSSTLSSSIRIYSLHNSKVLKTLRASEYRSEKYPSPPVLIGNAVLAGSENGKVIVWDLNERKVLSFFDAHSSPIVALASSGDILATGSLDHDIRLLRMHCS